MSTGQTTQGVSEGVSETAAPTSARPVATVGPGPDLAAFLDGLLDLHCRIAGAIAGVIYLAGSEKRRAGLVTRRVSAGFDDALRPAVLERLEQLGADVCEGASAQAPSPRVEPITIARAGALYGDEASHRVIAMPLAAAGAIEGASLVVVPPVRPAELRESAEKIALAATHFEAFLWRQHALGEARQKAMLRETLELLDASQRGASAKAMGALMCHELARRFGCTRVSIGLIHGPARRLRLAAVSGADEVDRRGAAAEALEGAMEECALQDIELVYPEPPEAKDDPGAKRVLRDHQQLSQKYGPSAILSLPLRIEGDLVGVVVLERPMDDPFPPGAIPLLRLAAEFIGPALWTRRLADRGVLAVTRDRIRWLAEAAVGPRHTVAKTVIGLIAIILVLAAVVPIPRRVKAEAELRAGAARTVVPPFVGYLDEALVQPGTVVKAGDLLARMSTTELDLQLNELLARRSTLVLQRDEAAASGKATEALATEASLRETQAQIDLLRNHITKSEIRSPIDGTVSRGELRDFIGARVEPTQALLEVVDDRRIVLIRVDETDIARVSVGQTGRLAARARPEERVDVRVVRINPVAEPVRGANVYLVECEIVDDDPATWLRAGETGIVKLDAGSTTLMSAILGPVVDELRMRWWF